MCLYQNINRTTERQLSILQGVRHQKHFLLKVQKYYEVTILLLSASISTHAQDLNYN